MKKILIRFSKLLFLKKRHQLLFSVIIGLLILFVSHQNGFFWDNIFYGSKTASHLYNNGIFAWDLDSIKGANHLPFFGFILSIMWILFGKSILVSHLVILPFIIGTFYQLLQLNTYFLKKQLHQFLAFVIVCFIPSVSTSMTIVNHEIIITFFSLLAINGILRKNRFTILIAFLFLGIISYRSMMILFGIFLFDIINSYYINKEKITKLVTKEFLLKYIISAILPVSFIIYKISSKGYIVDISEDSPWGSHWQIATFKTFLKNLVILVHRYLDFGKVFVFIFIGTIFIFHGKKLFCNKKNKQLVMLAISSVSIIILVVILTSSPFGHRYFIVSYIFLVLFAFNLLIEFALKKRLVYSLLFVGLITGNLWVYPKHISQGWDATLGHIPYHSMRLDAIHYLEKNNIEISKTGSFFPNLSTFDYVDCNGDKRKFATFNKKNKYVFYSNIYNLSDEDLNILNKKYTSIKQFNKYNIHINIYKLKK